MCVCVANAVPRLRYPHVLWVQSSYKLLHVIRISEFSHTWTPRSIVPHTQNDTSNQPRRLACEASNDTKYEHVYVWIYLFAHCSFPALRDASHEKKRYVRPFNNLSNTWKKEVQNRIDAYDEDNSRTCTKQFNSMIANDCRKWKPKFSKTFKCVMQKRIRWLRRIWWQWNRDESISKHYSTHKFM